MLPTIALVGRPNVGKSTLFNRLTRSRNALVADFPGLTRDRQYGQGHMGDRKFVVIDTGGFEPVAKEGILKEMARQTLQALDEADVVIFLVDGRAGVTPQDARIADLLRKRASCGVTPARPSTRKITTSASSSACNVCRAISFKMPSLATGSKPPVSMTTNLRSPI